MYQPVLVPIGGTNAAAVRTNRDDEAISVGHGLSVSSIDAETEIGLLGRLRGIR